MNTSVKVFCRICLFFLLFSFWACAPGPPPPPFPGFEWIILGVFALAGILIWKKTTAAETPKPHALEETLNALNEQLKKLEEKIDRLEKSRNEKDSH
ncbi:MAG: hypothetical protein GXO69_07180 [Acidobacteria bacterium]|nr:hypothetical protein [Acidobacteriota bacterium]